MAAGLAEEFKSLLVTQGGIGTFAATSGWGIYIGREPLAPDTVITLYDTGGLAPDPKWLIDFPSVQVRIRGAKGSYQAAYSKAQQVKDTLLGCTSQTLASGLRLVSVTGLGDLVSIGHDDNERPVFTVNFRAITHPVASTETNRQALP